MMTATTPKYKGIGRGNSPNRKIFDTYKVMSIDIPIEWWTYLRKIGNNNVSKGFRLCVDNLKPGDITQDDIDSLDKQSIQATKDNHVVSVDEAVKKKLQKMRHNLNTRTYLLYVAAIRRHKEMNT